MCVTSRGDCSSVVRAANVNTKRGQNGLLGMTIRTHREIEEGSTMGSVDLNELTNIIRVVGNERKGVVGNEGMRVQKLCFNQG